jgi:hypothetical protein
LENYRSLGREEVELRETQRAVTPFGGLVVFFEFLRRIGYCEAVQQHLPFTLRSPNAIDPVKTFTAFLLSVVAGARRFAHTSLLRADAPRATAPSPGRKLLEVPGYTFRVFVTNLVLTPEEIWRDYNRRSDMENRIAELKHDLAADDFCLQEFFATEAAFRSILLLFNLLGEFQRAAGLATYRQPPSCVLKCSSAGLSSAARVTVWFFICRLLGVACSGAFRCWEVS